MRRIKKLKTLVYALMGTTLISACSSDADDVISEAGKGYVSLSVQADAGFQTTRAASEDYEDVNNYTVQILQGDKIVGDSCEWKYSKLPDEIELPNGTYTFKAFYGKDNAVNTENPYVEGVVEKTINSNGQNVEISCSTTDAKVTVAFDEKMDEYFSDYSVVFKTKAMSSNESCIWTKDEADKTYYLKVENNEKIDAIIKLTNKETKQSTEQKLDVTLSPGLNKLYTFEPTGGNEEEGGSDGLGIKITIDKSTNDKEVDIIIPSTWF